VTFSEAVNGVNAGDLLVNGQPASSLTIGTNNTYVFNFVQPVYGTVQISWAAGHGIEDLAFPPNPFNSTAAGATWQYTLQDRTAPTVVGTVPTPGFTVRSLSQVEISFSEPVEALMPVICGSMAQRPPRFPAPIRAAILSHSRSQRRGRSKWPGTRVTAFRTWLRLQTIS
jgi:hypothetical protein